MIMMVEEIDGKKKGSLDTKLKSPFLCLPNQKKTNKNNKVTYKRIKTSLLPFYPLTLLALFLLDLHTSTF
jgi:hypothetical protein